MILFTKTWKNDFQWLKVAMVSVRKFCSTDIEWKIVLDDGTRSEFMPVLEQVKQATPDKKLNVHVYETSDHWKDSLKIHNGYIRQQWIKMNAHRVIPKGYFWNWDSDVIAQRPFIVDDLMRHGKPIHWITQFNALMGSSDDHAHNVRRQMMAEIYGNTDFPYEYMRCMPMPMMGEILKYGSESSYWEKAYELARSSDQRFSEFNIIGYYSHKYFPDCYEWQNTQNFERTFAGPWGDKKYIIAQGWSWGGCPEEIYNEVMK